MKNLIIIGAGGMGRTIYSNALESVGYGTDFIVKGFIDDNLNALDDKPNYPDIVGTISCYQPEPGDVFISSIGGGSRKKIIESIISRGGEFMNLVHRTSSIHTNANLGKGNFLGAFVIIGNDVTIGDNNMIQSYTVIGHDAVIGNWNRLDTHVTCVGGIVIGNETNIHTSAVISHGVRVGDCAHVGALSFVIRSVKPGTTVLGNPAKKLEL